MKSIRLRLKIFNIYKNIEIYKTFVQMAQHKYCLEAIINFLSNEFQIFKSYISIFILPCKTASQCQPGETVVKLSFLFLFVM